MGAAPVRLTRLLPGRPVAACPVRGGRPPSRAPRGVCVANSVQHRRTYVLDTSVLLSDPSAIMRFDEHHVVLPVAVLTDPEAKRHHPQPGYLPPPAPRPPPPPRAPYRAP